MINRAPFIKINRLYAHCYRVLASPKLNNIERDITNTTSDGKKLCHSLQEKGIKMQLMVLGEHTNVLPNSPLLPQNEHSPTHNSCYDAFFPLALGLISLQKPRWQHDQEKLLPVPPVLSLEVHQYVTISSKIPNSNTRMGNSVTHPQLREEASFSQVLSGLGLILKVSPICNWRIFWVFAKICEDGASTNLSLSLKVTQSQWRRMSKSLPQNIAKPCRLQKSMYSPLVSHVNLHFPLSNSDT